MKKTLVAGIAAASLLVGATAAYASTQYNLQSGGTVDHIIVEDTITGVGPGGVGNTIPCPENYYTSGGGYSLDGPTSFVFTPSFDGPAASWGPLGTAWSVAGNLSIAGDLRVWAICIKLT